MKKTELKTAKLLIYLLDIYILNNPPWLSFPIPNS
jgi:hypothetical protein